MTINVQLTFLSGQELFRIWLPGNFNKSGFVTDNSHIKMYDFFFKSGSPSKCLSHLVAQKFLTPSYPAVSLTRSPSLPPPASWVSIWPFSQSCLISFSPPVLWEPFLSSVIFPRHQCKSFFLIYSSILPKIKQIILQMLDFQVQGNYSW